ncbi:hypothetical protein ACHAWF_004465 [Thalassiosira exigua]
MPMPIRFRWTPDDRRPHARMSPKANDAMRNAHWIVVLERHCCLRRRWRWILILILASARVMFYYYPRVQTERQAFDPLVDRCSIPKSKGGRVSSLLWRYFDALVDVNLNAAANALRFTSGPERGPNSAESSSPIPSRIVFTHRHNLFDCSVTASTERGPDLLALSENVKATVRAYRKIWPDVDVVFLNDVDCIGVIEQVEPGLIPFFDGLEGAYPLRLSAIFRLPLAGLLST